jgi:LysR family transcriptional regulator, low CO2-responsive transcriptional regulator
MTIDAIRLFISTAKHLNITKAAQELRISQSTASRRLTQFQADLGTILLKHNGRGIELTKSGRAYLLEVSPIYSQFETLQRKHNRNRESLAIAGSLGISTHILPSLMTSFSTTHPSAKLELYPCSSSEAEEILLAGKVDLAIIGYPLTLSNLLTMESYRNEPLSAFVRANHPLAQSKELKISAIGAFSLIIRNRKEGQSRTETELAAFAKNGTSLKITMQCATPEGVKEAVRHGAGIIGILYGDAVKQEIDQGEFKAIQIEGFNVTRQTYVVYLKEKPLSSLAREFLLLLRASMTKDTLNKTTVAQNSHGRGNGVIHDHMLRSKLRY